jgi:hypothetical protein
MSGQDVRAVLTMFQDARIDVLIGVVSFFARLALEVHAKSGLQLGETVFACSLLVEVSTVNL